MRHSDESQALELSRSSSLASQPLISRIPAFVGSSLESDLVEYAWTVMNKDVLSVVSLMTCHPVNNDRAFTQEFTRAVKLAFRGAWRWTGTAHPPSASNRKG